MPARPSDYQARFEERGATYDDAMARWPDARAEEFEFVVDLAAPQAGEALADVPAGGGYLADRLPDGVRYLAVEPSAAFAGRCRDRGLHVVESALPADAVADATMDVVVSIAGVHHEQDLLPILRGWARILRPGGRVVLADVVAGSPVAAFLDGFVGAHNEIGHDGWFLDDGVPALVAAAGFERVAVRDGDYHWWFSHEDELAAYCSVLFGLGAVEPAEVLAAVDAGPGIDRPGDGRVGMRWGLRAVTGVRPAG